jgi:hypothetical protein
MTRHRLVLPALAGIALLLGACATPPVAEGPPRKETLLVVTEDHELVRVNAGQPQRVLKRVAIRGLGSGETVRGIDFRVARGQLYLLTDAPRLYRVDPASGQATPLGSAVIPVKPAGQAWGFDFNPVADRIRWVSESGENWRLHPDTGTVVDSDPQAAGLQSDGPLRYVAGDAQANQVPRLLAAAYTYNQRDDKLTTNYAIDGRSGTLVIQGSLEGTQPVVSPNTGQLRTVGPLGLGPLKDASFDIADINNAAFLVERPETSRRSRLHLVDLSTGRASLIGEFGVTGTLRGLAVEP